MQVPGPTVTYETIPFIAFFECLQDPVHLETYKYDKTDFDAIREIWENKNELDSEEFYLYRKSYKKNVYINQLHLALTRYSVNPDCEEIFLAIGLPWPVPGGDVEAWLTKEIGKDTQTVKATQRQVMRLLEEKQGERKFSKAELYETIASIQHFGFTTGPMHEYKLIEYEAHAALIDKMKEQQKQKNV